MPKHVRRSLVAISIADHKLGDTSFSSWADAIILEIDKASGLDFVKSRMPVAIGLAAKGGAEVFVRIDSATATEQLDAAVCPGLTGIVLCGVERPQEVEQVSHHLTGLEDRRGIVRGSLQIDVAVGTASAVWHSLEIARASSRVAALTVSEIELYHSLGIPRQPKLEFDPLEYVKSQLITNAVAAGCQAQGMAYPISIASNNAPEAELQKAVRRARDMGFKGAACPHLSWVKICNEGFCPSPGELAYYRKVREVFAEGVRRGLASVPLDGRMVDVPVDMRAKVFLEWADRCAERDVEKAEAHKGGS